MKDTRRARMSLGLLLAAALVLMTWIIGRGRTLLSARSGGSARRCSAPPRARAPGVVRPIGQFFETMTGAPEAQRRIEALRAENKRLKHDLAAQSLDRKRSAELRSLLGVAGTGGYKIVPAQVIARRGTPGFEEAVELDVGTADGVRPEMTVLNGDGLVAGWSRRARPPRPWSCSATPARRPVPGWRAATRSAW